MGITLKVTLLGIALISYMPMAGYCDDGMPRKAAEIIQEGDAAKIPAAAMTMYGQLNQKMVDDKNSLNAAVESNAATKYSGTMSRADEVTILVDESGAIPDGAISGISGDVKFAPGTIVNYSGGTLTIGGISYFSAPSYTQPGLAGSLSIANNAQAGGIVSGEGAASIIVTGQLPAQLIGSVYGPIGIGVTTTTTSTVTADKDVKQQEQANAKFIMDRVQKQRQALRDAIDGKKNIIEE